MKNPIAPSGDVSMERKRMSGKRLAFSMFQIPNRSKLGGIRNK